MNFGSTVFKNPARNALIEKRVFTVKIPPAIVSTTEIQKYNVRQDVPIALLQ